MDTIRLALALLRALFTKTPAWIDTRTGRILPMIAGAEDATGDDADSDDAGAGDRDDAPDDGGDSDDAGAAKVAPDDDWKTKSRKHETRAKRAEREAAELRKKLAEREDQDKSEQQKAIEKAKREARDEVMGEVEKERREARLEAAVTRSAARGFEIEVDGEQTTVRFADPDDAQVYIDRAIAKGELDADEIFDEDGKVEGRALNAALAEILEEKPHLRDGGSGKPKSDPDRGKGSAAQKDLEDLSVAEHDRLIREGIK